jgi:hypothetical protein
MKKCFSKDEIYEMGGEIKTLLRINEVFIHGRKTGWFLRGNGAVFVIL